ncbi:V-type immunoglobulin domain-containing suppressor of T-cell activation [Monodelphis domestica]|uniref:V-type immunoglobulin domain-containing suppressor of T-cell activation n=1 Tax=Monodelphis domestica TaxID=13616 RepID=UPI0024E1FC8E|nr:V-type immunoglobulin domain-containing suppressor of T-cell activation [Monodelphis domestica]
MCASAPTWANKAAGAPSRLLGVLYPLTRSLWLAGLTCCRSVTQRGFCWGCRQLSSQAPDTPQPGTPTLTMELRPGAALGPWGLLLLALCLASSRGQVAALKITIPYSLYVCPEGQNISLTCRISGPFTDRHDLLYKTWHMGHRENQSCSEKMSIRNVTERELHPRHGGHHANASGQNPAGHKNLTLHHGVELTSDHHGNFSITLLNLTQQDGGIYCCLVVEYKHHHLEQEVHGFVELQVQKGQVPLSKCTLHPATPQENENITAAALATGACIVGILCLPLILLLVYKQQQAASNRRAHELVRMESNAQGIENPTFEAVPHGIPELKSRPPLSYMAQRQPSESGRHLLSEPSTPLSPPGPGDVFFPSLDPVPDSPNAEAI